MRYVWQKPAQALRRLKSNLRVGPLSENYSSLSEWFDTPMGKALLEAERDALSEQLNCRFGYHLMQLSSVAQADFSDLSRINHCFRLAPTSEQGTRYPHAQSVSDFEALPLEDEVVDVTILHHVLEYSDNPHLLLKEAARVTMPRGYVIIVAFNPLSFAGLLNPINLVFRGNAVSRRRALRLHRVTDWLEFLDFSCVDKRYVFHNLPINHKGYLTSSRIFTHWFDKPSIPLGASFCLLARKDKAGLTPIKPLWEDKNLLDVIPGPKQALKARVAHSARVLPFRNKIKKDV